MTQTQIDDRGPAPAAPKVRRARESEDAQVKAVIARAFDDDPFVNWCVAQDKRRARRVYEMMEMAHRIARPHNEIYTTDGVEGAAFWSPPGKSKVGMLQQLQLMPATVRALSVRRLPTVMRAFTAIDNKHPHEPHWYLSVLGVDPDLQGRGIGTALMRPVLEMCDRDGTPAYLESSKEKNVPLYERNGFRVTEVFEVPGGGPPMWLMWRDPQ